MSVHYVKLFRVAMVLYLVALIPIGCKKSEATSTASETLDRYTPFPGEISGEPVRDAVHVSVVDAVTGKPVKGAIVQLHRGSPYESVAQGETSKEGILDLAVTESQDPLAITVRGAETQAYDTISVLGVQTSALTIPFTLRPPYRQHPVSISFQGLTAADASLLLFEGDSEGRTVPLVMQTETVLTQPDPYRIRIPVTSPGFSALTFDVNRQVRNVGYIPLFDIPIARNAKYTMVMASPNSTDVKEIDCTIDASAIVAGKSARFCQSPQYTVVSFADSGTTGRITTGRAEMVMPGNVTLRVHRLQDVRTVSIEASVECPDMPQRSVAMARFAWDSMPAAHVFVLKKPASGLELIDLPDRRFPGLKWIAGDGTMVMVHVYQREFSYHWSLLMKNKPGENRMELPPIDVGIAGSLCDTFVYEYVVETFHISNEGSIVESNAITFEALGADATQRSLSMPLQFTIHGLPTPTPSPEPTLQPYEPVATDITPSIEPTPTPVLDENGIEVIPAPEG